MKKVTCYIICVLLIISNSITIKAKSGYSYVLMEAKTSTLLYSDNGTERIRPHHSAKLMVLYLLCCEIENDKIGLDDKIRATQNAFSEKGPSIWLSAGEEITVRELILSITVGNANDASVAIAEHISCTKADFVSLMNQTAEEIGMVNTRYYDVTGESYNGYTTAEDIVLLTSYLLKYDFLKDYFRTYITYIKNDKVQLVNTNRLIRSYDLSTGVKYYYGEDCKNVLISSAAKGDVEIICVIIGEEDKDQIYKTAKEKLSVGLSAYKLYKPKTSKVILKEVEVKKGSQSTVKAKLSLPDEIVIRKSYEDDIYFEIEFFDEIIAPVEVGDTIGYVVYKIDDETIYSLPILASEKVEKRTYIGSVIKLFKNIVAM